MTVEARRHALVTGAGGDIGAAITRRLLDDGLDVTAVDVKAEEEIAARFGGTDPGPRTASVDLRSRSAVAALLADLPPVDVLVGNAGIGGTSAFLDLDDDLWQRTLDVNLTANFVLGQLVARGMVERGAGGTVVFTGSWVGAVPWPDITAYTVSKAGLVMLARQMARELAQHRIRVNVVAPGIVRAGMAGQLLQDDPVYAARAARVVPLGEFQTPEQVAGAVAFLCTEDGAYVTGTVLLTDGGASLFQFDSDLG